MKHTLTLVVGMAAGMMIAIVAPKFRNDIEKVSTKAMNCMEDLGKKVENLYYEMANSDKNNVQMTNKPIQQNSKPQMNKQKNRNHKKQSKPNPTTTM